MLDLALRGATGEWPVVNILAARKFNLMLGGAFVAPWQLSDIPDEWIEATTMMSDGLPKMRAGLSEIETLKASIRANHPTYRKTHH